MNSKKIYLQRVLGLILFATLFTALSCKKSFLDAPRQGLQPVAQFWQSQDDATKAVSAMYANLHEWKNIAFAPIAVESMGSDDVLKGSSPSDASFMNDFQNFTASSTEGQIADFWSGEYQTINFANQNI